MKIAGNGTQAAPKAAPRSRNTSGRPTEFSEGFVNFSKPNPLYNVASDAAMPCTARRGGECWLRQ